MTTLKKSPFSRHFNILLLIGAWYYETNSKVKLNIFILYKLAMTLLGLYGILSLMVDFYLVMGDFKKMTWNLFASVLFDGMFLKTGLLLPRHHCVNRLRLNLHQDAESRTTPEDVLSHDIAVRQLRFLQFLFYSAAVIFVPIWLLARYFNNKNELPAPVRLLYANLDDPVEFQIWFFLIALSGVVVIVLSLEQELAMYALLIQISREYIVLMKDIPKVNELYEMGSLDKHKEVNPFLKKLKTKLLLKKFSARQRELINYVKVFEECYNQSLLHEFFCLSILIVIVSLHFMLEPFTFSGNVMFQMGYLVIITLDMFLICWFSTKLNEQCYKIGEAAYSTLWYEMDVECQKYIALMILRSQHPPKITTAKLMVLDLNAFMNRINNVISWLALFRELLLLND